MVVPTAAKGSLLALIMSTHAFGAVMPPTVLRSHVIRPAYSIFRGSVETCAFRMSTADENAMSSRRKPADGLPGTSGPQRVPDQVTTESRLADDIASFKQQMSNQETAAAGSYIVIHFAATNFWC